MVRKTLILLSLLVLNFPVIAEMYSFSGLVNQSTDEILLPLDGELKVNITTSSRVGHSGSYSLLLDDSSLINITFPNRVSPTYEFVPLETSGQIQSGFLKEFYYRNGIPINSNPYYNLRIVSEFYFTQDGDWFFDLIFSTNPSSGVACPPRGSGWDCEYFGYITAGGSSYEVKSVPLPSSLILILFGLPLLIKKLQPNEEISHGHKKAGAFFFQ